MVSKSKLLLLTLAGFVLMSMQAFAQDEQTPESVYMEYHAKLLKATKFAEIKPFLAKDALEDGPPEDQRDQMIGLIKELAPKVVNIASQSVDGQKATLELTVPTEGNENTTGTVTMVLEDGQWKLLKEKWKTSSTGTGQ